MTDNYPSALVAGLGRKRLGNRPSNPVIASQRIAITNDERVTGQSTTFRQFVAAWLGFSAVSTVVTADYLRL